MASCAGEYCTSGLVCVEEVASGLVCVEEVACGLVCVEEVTLSLWFVHVPIVTLLSLAAAVSLKNKH